jgi:hypothetical protein
MTWLFAPVPGEEVQAVWPEAWSCLKPAVEMTEGKFDERSIIELVRRGNLQLWIASSLDKDERIAVATELVVYPCQKWCRIVFVGGKGLSSAFDFLGTIEDWAMTQGCVGLETGGRPEWGRPLRRFGYSERARSYQRKFDA